MCSAPASPGAYKVKQLLETWRAERWGNHKVENVTPRRSQHHLLHSYHDCKLMVNAVAPIITLPMDDELILANKTRSRLIEDIHSSDWIWTIDGLAISVDKPDRAM